jgi:signal peptidase II
MKKRINYSLIIISLIVVFDQATKYLARSFIDPYEIIEVLPILNLVNVRNEGAAFGMFKSFGNTFFILISVVAIVFILWVIITGREDYRFFSLLAGGAVGNLVDRIIFSYVTDFIDITVWGYHWPAFNAADSALTVGIIFVMLKMIIIKN